jgi:hypothetical protein
MTIRSGARFIKTSAFCHASLFRKLFAGGPESVISIPSGILFLPARLSVDVPIANKNVVEAG